MALKQYIGVLGDNGGREHIIDAVTGAVVLDLSHAVRREDWDESWQKLPSGNFMSINWGATSVHIVRPSGDIEWSYIQRADTEARNLGTIDDNRVRINAAEDALFSYDAYSALTPSRVVAFTTSKTDSAVTMFWDIFNPDTGEAPGGMSPSSRYFFIAEHMGVEKLFWMVDTTQNYDLNTCVLWAKPLAGGPAESIPLPVWDGTPDVNSIYPVVTPTRLIFAVSGDSATNGYYTMMLSGTTWSGRTQLVNDAIYLNYVRAEVDMPSVYQNDFSNYLMLIDYQMTSNRKFITLGDAGTTDLLTIPNDLSSYPLYSTGILNHAGYNFKLVNIGLQTIRPTDVPGELLVECSFYHLTDTTFASSSGSCLVRTNATMDTILQVLYLDNIAEQDIDGWEPMWFDEYVISGSVTDGSTPIEGAVVSIINNDGLSVCAVKTDAAGAYTIPCISAEPRRICVVTPDNRTKIHGAVVPVLV